jgi:hypothetical protein
LTPTLTGHLQTPQAFGSGFHAQRLQTRVADIFASIVGVAVGLERYNVLVNERANALPIILYLWAQCEIHGCP